MMQGHIDMAANVVQIPFDLGHRNAQGREDFLIAPCNRDAVAQIDQWPRWTAPVLVLCGPAASGKSHLAAVWRAMSDAVVIDLSQGQPADQLFATGNHFMIDAADAFIGDRESETILFHLYNMAKEQNKTILMTSRAAPKQLEFKIADLASRLRAAPLAMIASPDEELLGAVMIKMFADRQVQVADDVLSYVLPRMERSFAGARDIVERADHLALAEKKPVSIALMRRILLDDIREQEE